MPAPIIPALKLALPLLRVAGPMLARMLPAVRQAAPLVAVLRTVASGYTAVVSWWIGYQDGILTPAEKRAIWSALLAVELVALPVARQVKAILMQPYERLRR